ncbi:MAG: hypothetical protein ACE5HK_06130 [Candidatus Methylomirabilales bacterium]
MSPRTRDALKVADEVWIATALLHREHPKRADFTIAEIVERAREEKLSPQLRPGVYVHAVQHCVANRPPNPGRYRMLVETGENRRRLFRPGDPYHPNREGAKIAPARENIPAEYHELLDWYEQDYARRGARRAAGDPLLALRGSGRALWVNEHADDYVKRLREGWE